MPKSSRGFTLVEMLVALAVLSLVAAALGPTLFGVTRTWSKVNLEAEFVDDELVADAALRRLFQNAVHPGNTGDEVVFEGSPTELNFVTINGVEEPEAVSLRIVPRERASVLLLEISAFPRSAVEVAPIELRRFENSAVFSYFSGIGDTASERWRAEWSNGALPKLVRLETVELAGPKASIYHLYSDGPLWCVWGDPEDACRGQ